MTASLPDSWTTFGSVCAFTTSIWKNDVGRAVRMANRPNVTRRCIKFLPLVRDISRCRECHYGWITACPQSDTIAAWLICRTKIVLPNNTGRGGAVVSAIDDHTVKPPAPEIRSDRRAGGAHRIR